MIFYEKSSQFMELFAMGEEKSLKKGLMWIAFLPALFIGFMLMFLF